jgi:succinate-acetate transporter protein
MEMILGFWILLSKIVALSKNEASKKQKTKKLENVSEHKLSFFSVSCFCLLEQVKWKSALTSERIFLSLSFFFILFLIADNRKK